MARIRLSLTSSGMGNATVKLVRKGKVLGTFTHSFAGAGTATITIVLPKTAHKVGKYTFQLIAAAPVGAAQSRSSVKLEVRKK